MSPGSFAGGDGAADGGAAAAPICVTGRFQPCHRQHLELLRYALAHGQRLIVGITNPEPAGRVAHPASPHRHLASANPLSYAQRASLVTAALRLSGVADGQFDVVPFPLDEPGRWHGLLPPGTRQLVRVFSDWEREKVRRFTSAGLPVIVLEGDPCQRLSASDIRERIGRGQTWQDDVPDGAQQLLEAWLADASLRAAFATTETVAHA